MEVEGNIMNRMEQKRQKGYGHLQRMPHDMLPNTVWQWQPTTRWKRRRPREERHKQVQRGMKEKDLQENDWEDKVN